MIYYCLQKKLYASVHCKIDVYINRYRLFGDSEVI